MNNGDTENSSLETRRRRLMYRAWHRGTREMDLLLGRFVEARVGGMSIQTLAELEALLDIPDAELFDRLIRPASADKDIVSAIRHFHDQNPASKDAHQP